MSFGLRPIAHPRCAAPRERLPHLPPPLRGATRPAAPLGPVPSVSPPPPALCHLCVAVAPSHPAAHRRIRLRSTRLHSAPDTTDLVRGMGEWHWGAARRRRAEIRRAAQQHTHATKMTHL